MPLLLVSAREILICCLRFGVFIFPPLQPVFCHFSSFFCSFKVFLFCFLDFFFIFLLFLFLHGAVKNRMLSIQRYDIFGRKLHCEQLRKLTGGRK